MVVSLVALHFAMFATLGLDSVFLRVCFRGLGRLFLVSNLSYGFSVI
ncbi:hypothetical protein HID58_043301 [Brassica napus]|uniref:Uncharacterized protein n=1 Tax=Brassica napus TaxID=3708 RepID=A0ABQ8BGH0_BRANA|nr:hypothetical protein HID58_043301 [Brassica napus]